MSTPNQPRNIYLVGAHCTGKTTLVEGLRAHLSPNLVSELYGENAECPAIVDELVRNIMRTDGFTASDVRHPTKGLELQTRTMLAQHQAEVNLGNKWFISDRSGIDPIVYAEVFLGRPEAEKLAEMKEWHVLREKMKKAYVIVCEPENASWLSTDRVRVACNDVEEWRSIARAFRTALQNHGIPYVTIPVGMEDLGKRVQFVEELLRSSAKSGVF
ncbi:hypothetical protein BP00DRAFT_334626 [Aspergillus indologenus CBS 114.80]|uniref:NadR/Ttd14 AAA domain-containing protein n=1 Tax=Aspergillus indologenus CBS 114.80 TaxID=1450541 RepID=A0A2V5J0X0_9EURO|nr:hypothetical protein BP00DRAFT_334626 [Aspergillus indologenus CBS 114.80]